MRTQCCGALVQGQCPDCPTSAPTRPHGQTVMLVGGGASRNCIEAVDEIPANQAQHIAELQKTIRALCAARPQVIAFALAMEAKLKARDERGRRGWIGMPYTHLLQRLRHETYELQNQVDVLELEAQIASPAAVLDEAVDVANFAMMIADNAGAL